MEVKIQSGKRKNSRTYFIPEKDAVYKLKQENNLTVYVWCYFDTCTARGTIKDSKFHDVCGFENHGFHPHTTQHLLKKFEFYRELRKNSSIIGKALKRIFDETYAK
jgi:Cys-tRNA synthase (O-phospho-L-seryl-tRNA:Cys-tRNA synthase)